MANTFSLQIKGLDQLARDAQRVGGEMPEMLRQAMVKSTNIIKDDARKKVLHKTGTLRRSINVIRATAKKGVIAVGEDYGIYIETGTKAHGPVRAKALMIPVKAGTPGAKLWKGKHVIYRKWVKGIKAHPFMEPAFKNNADEVLREFEQVGLQVVRKLGD